MLIAVNVDEISTAIKLSSMLIDNFNRDKWRN